MQRRGGVLPRQSTYWRQGEEKFLHGKIVVMTRYFCPQASNYLWLALSPQLLNMRYLMNRRQHWYHSSTQLPDWKKSKNKNLISDIFQTIIPFTCLQLLSKFWTMNRINIPRISSISNGTLNLALYSFNSF